MSDVTARVSHLDNFYYEINSQGPGYCLSQVLSNTLRLYSKLNKLKLFFDSPYIYERVSYCIKEKILLMHIKRCSIISGPPQSHRSLLVYLHCIILITNRSNVDELLSGKEQTKYLFAIWDVLWLKVYVLVILKTVKPSLVILYAPMRIDRLRNRRNSR